MVSEDYPTDLGIKVGKLLNEGYEPLGTGSCSMTVVGSHSTRKVYTQAMVKKEPIIENNSAKYSFIEKWQKEADRLGKVLDIGRHGRDDGSYDDGKYNTLLECIEDVEAWLKTNNLTK